MVAECWASVFNIKPRQHQTEWWECGDTPLRNHSPDCGLWMRAKAYLMFTFIKAHSISQNVACINGEGKNMPIKGFSYIKDIGIALCFIYHHIWFLFTILLSLLLSFFFSALFFCCQKPSILSTLVFFLFVYALSVSVCKLSSKNAAQYQIVDRKKKIKANLS